MKKNVILLTMLILSLVFTGCSTTQLEFWEKNKATSDWEASDMDMDMKVTVTDVSGTHEMYMDINGVTNTEDISGHLQISMKDGTGQVAIDNVDTYVKDGKVYMSKDYLIDVAKLSGVAFPEDFLEEGVEFITFAEANAQAELMQTFINNPELTEEILKFYEEFATIIGLDIPVEKVDNTYRIQMDQEDMVKLVKAIIYEGTAQLDKINEQFKLGYDEAEIAKAKAEVEELKPLIEELCITVTQLFKGELIMEITFGEDTITQTIKMSFSDPLLTQMAVAVEMNAKLDKVPAQVITIPGKTQEITEAELTQAMLGDLVVVDLREETLIDTTEAIIPCKSIMTEETVYVECKPTLKAFGSEVVYNPTLKQVGIQGEEFTPLNVITEGGTSYISAEELANLGYTVTVGPGYVMIQAQ